MIDKVQSIIRRYRELETELAARVTGSDAAHMDRLGREYNTLGKSMPVYFKYADLIDKISQAEHILQTEPDAEFRDLAKTELEQYRALQPALEEQVKYLLVPRDPDDRKNAIVEIRAGTGGTEAGIFAADLFRMYSRYLERKGWGLDLLSSSYGDVGSIKEIVFLVNGDGAYGALKFESGVHRVQRVPQTEAQGRIHTSAASVVVLPEADEVEMTINPGDLRVDVYRSSGHGGQSVNTTDSAVRIVHIPTGIMVTCQDEKSQLKNKAKALKVLQSRLYDQKLSEMNSRESAARKSMIGSGDRSEKIRTYNFPQSRVTDHRINLSLYRLPSIVNGDIQELLDALSVADLDERIKA